MFCFMTSDPEIIVKCREEHGGAVNSAVSSWWSLGGGSWFNGPEIFFFYI